MSSMLRNTSFHHIEVPCDDLELAERFYVIVFGARVYMRRDSSRRTGTPATGTIAEAEQQGFEIDGTYRNDAGAVAQVSIADDEVALTRIG